jgi:hypothetical protein
MKKLFLFLLSAAALPASSANAIKICQLKADSFYFATMGNIGGIIGAWVIGTGCSNSWNTVGTLAASHLDISSKCSKPILSGITKASADTAQMGTLVSSVSDTVGDNCFCKSMQGKKWVSLGTGNGDNCTHVCALYVKAHYQALLTAN